MDAVIPSAMPSWKSGKWITTACICTVATPTRNATAIFKDSAGFLRVPRGEYYFRTIKPVLYPGRTRHIHYAVKMKGREKWTTQCYVKGESANEKDGIYNSIKEPKARASVTIDFAPLKTSRMGELAAKFDIVMGWTPAA